MSFHAGQLWVKVDDETNVLCLTAATHGETNWLLVTAGATLYWNVIGHYK